MQAVSRASQSTFPRIDQADIEPDETWKTTLRRNIEDSLNDMVREAKENLESRLKEGHPKDATETFHAELEREREQRRWAAGQAMRPEWTEALKQEQQAILDKINHEKAERAKGKSDDQVSGTKPPDIGLGRPSPISPATAPPMFVSPTSQHSPFSPLPPTPDREEREKRSAPAQGLRRATDSFSSSSPRDDFSSPSGRRNYGSFRGERPRPDAWESWGHQELGDDPEELLRPPERSRPPIERSLALDKPGETTPSRPIERSTRSSSERHAAHSPPGPVEIWRPSISPEEDAAASRPHLRRGSTASLRSNGSYPTAEPLIPDRPTLLERSNIAEYATIPENVDDTLSQDTRENVQREKERLQEVDASWAAMERSREKERQTVARTDSRQSSSSDQGQRRDEQSVSSARAAGKASARPQDSSTTYQQPSAPIDHLFHEHRLAKIIVNFHKTSNLLLSYPTPPPSHRPVVPRASFTRDEDIYGTPGSRSTNRSSTRLQDPPPSHRPISSRTAYSVEDREYRTYDDRPRVPSNGSNTKATTRPSVDYSSGPKPVTRQLSAEGYEGYPYEERPRAPSSGNYSSRQPMESPSTSPHPATPSSHRTYASQAPSSREEDDLYFQEEHRPPRSAGYPARSMTLRSALSDDRDYYPDRYTAPPRVSEPYTPFSMTRANGREYPPGTAMTT
ncbi:hypothetical protein BD779DRAFT_1675555 [Infundibulicybe gibba]|nr:hypothetical protein BD779DRAFT_1675555 [Infundibulicybe gibba]